VFAVITERLMCIHAPIHLWRAFSTHALLQAAGTSALARALR
jgi:hypothetical protein